MKQTQTQTPQPLFSKTTKADSFFFVYCLLHIPITVLIDSSLAIPAKYRPAIQNSIVDFHVSQNKDFLLKTPPTWLVFFGCIELFLQLPLFFIAAYALWKRYSSIYPYLFAYGVEAAATTLCCIVAIASQGTEYGLSDDEVMNLVAVYLPTFFIPVYMAIDTLSKDWFSGRAHKRE